MTYHGQKRSMKVSRSRPMKNVWKLVSDLTQSRWMCKVERDCNWVAQGGETSHSNIILSVTVL